MNTKLFTGLSVVLLTASACAATPSPEPGASSVSTLTKTQRYVSSVSNQARQHNVAVYWVNPPDEGDLVKFKDPESADTPANETEY
jgi:hypothetical protein